MKSNFSIFCALTVVFLSACNKAPDAHLAEGNKPEGTAAETQEAGAGEAVQLKEGHGITFHDKLRHSIDLKIAEVGEEKVDAELTTQLHVVQGAAEGGVEANAWLTAEKVARIKLGQQVELRAEGSTIAEVGEVVRIEKSLYAALGDFEVVVKTKSPFETGTRLVALFRSSAGDPMPAISSAAVLKTAEGEFVYTVNEQFFLRTPVKIGARNKDYVEITEGLYAGDQVVTSPVKSLWMAELQILRGGKACTCGH
jgi:hypothetical protein